MTDFAKYVYAMGRGPSKGRNLTRTEAMDAMAQILAGQVDPHAIGALLMLMRYRGETPNEIAGFVDAMRMGSTKWAELNIALDWPSYAAGRTRGLPWFLLSAKLVASAGFPIMLHGWNSHQNTIASVTNAVQNIGIPTCNTIDEANVSLRENGIIYCPLQALDPNILNLLKLRDVLGLRSAINTALRAYNPSRAPVSVQGVFHPSYRTLQSQSALLLKQETLAVIKGGGGEFECNPTKDTEVFIVQSDQENQYIAPAILSDTKRLSDASNITDGLQALWQGEIENTFAEKIIISTAAIALHACNPAGTYKHSLQYAADLWTQRPPINANG
ncbi:glycosyl transferase family protein [Amylibacter sp. SFDW26]|uniref:glycosyl transferase family protein n=1 Tax=Amylibacter sp. SFDW26 TaxID=2652722 RepID=UPI0012627986|nr:glycosyl transferase family protein [Amylibacter sp. SFDW26]KAB7610066.1 glycosyl transferase family protein [Amylibacter sp. SFDW26]